MLYLQLSDFKSGFGQLYKKNNRPVSSDGFDPFFYRALFWLSFTLGLSVLISAPGLTKTERDLPKLTIEERQWLDAHRGRVKLTPAPDWEPMEFYDDRGRYSGFVADYIRLIERKLDFKFHIFRTRTWTETLNMAREKEIDVISAAQPTPERKQFMIWSTPYFSINTTIIVQKTKRKNYRLEEMTGMTIGVPKDYAVGYFIRNRYPQLTLVDVLNSKDGLYKVSFGELDAMIMEVPAALYVIENEKITNLRLAGDTGFVLNMSVGVRNDWPILARVIEKTLSGISEREHQAIHSKWIRLETKRFYQSKSFWLITAGAFLVVFIVTGSVLVWNRTLKKRVIKQTESLRFNEMRLEALLQLNERTHDSIQEIIEFAFQQMIRLTKSHFGYLAFSDQDGIIYSVDSSSDQSIEKYITNEIAIGFSLETMGLWGEAVKQKKPLISNNYQITNPSKKGLPPEYRKLTRYMNVPIFKGGKVVVVAGMGNKKTDYDLSDLRQLSLLAQGMWRRLQRKQVEQAILRSEKNLRDLVENSPNGITIIQHGRAVYRNSKQLELIGEIEPVERIGYGHIYSEDLEKATLFYESIIDGNPLIPELSFRFYSSLTQRTQKTMKWVTCLVTPIDYKDDKAFLITTIDRTRARKLEHLLTIQDKMASLGRVAAGIAHEVRNPLSGINIYLRTLEKSIDEPAREHKIKPAIEAIRSASGKMESVIKRVVDFSKPIEPRMTLTDINIPVSEAVQLAATSLDKRGIVIKTDLDNTIPQCYAEPNLIEVVILNLINNAVDALDKTQGDKKIRVTTKTAVEKVIILVEDNGKGVANDLDERIFEPFFTTKENSTGIGLSLCHRIVTDHNGTITVVTSELGGAGFVVKLPKERTASKRNSIQSNTGNGP